MLSYQKFSIRDSDHFDPSKFPQLIASIQQTLEQLDAEPAVKIEMLISFVKNHCISSKQVKDYPALAGRISTGSLPLQLMETLFEAARKNSVFKTGLEQYIRSFTINNSQQRFRPIEKLST